MKKVICVVSCFILFTASILLVSCGTSSTSTGTNAAAATGKTFTLDELKTYNGQNGNPAYVAVSGVVYDVTNSSKWKNGKHETVVAGVDLTSAMPSSPHGSKVLSDLPIVGSLK